MGGALRTPLAGSPACDFAPVFVSIYVEFEFIMKVINDDDFENDDERTNSKKKTMFVSNDRSGHDDQFCPKIVKIGAILVR